MRQGHFRQVEEWVNDCDESFGPLVVAQVGIRLLNRFVGRIIDQHVDTSQTELCNTTGLASAWHNAVVVGLEMVKARMGFCCSLSRRSNADL